MRKYALFVLTAFLFLSFTFFSVSLLGQAEKKAAKEESKGNPAQRGFLNLTAEQKSKLQEFRKTRQEDMKQFQEKMRPLREKLQTLLRDPSSDLKEINALIDQTSSLRVDHQKKVIAQLREIRKIFTPEQLEKLKRLRRFARGRSFGRRGFGMFSPRGRMGFFRGRGGPEGDFPLMMMRRWLW
jgi:Spy/CpxP family protein refolding chaperone